MDAVKFVEARRRMFAMTGENPKYILFNMGTPAVEEWATAHPRKTRADEFLEHYPKASMGVAGVLDVPPCYIEPSLRSMCSEKACADCRREFWMQEVE